MVELELITLTGLKLKESVYEVLLPTQQGMIAVFPGHAPLVSLASPGVISVRLKENHPDDMMQRYAIASGMIEVVDNKLRVLVDEADKDSEIITKQAEEALARAKQLRSEARDQVSLEKAQFMVDRESARLKVAGLRRRKKR